MSQYFEEKNNKVNIKKEISINFDNKTYKLLTTDSMFSKNKLDYGTKLLLENITKKNIQGKVLDLGCGYGVIGILLAKTFPNTQIDMCDITERAIELTKENTKNIKNINVYKSDAYENIKDKYDYIITNPPIRAGKNTIRKFLLGAQEHLNELGELWFVMRKDHGVKSMIKELEETYTIEIKEKSKGFYIIICKLK